MRRFTLLRRKQVGRVIYQLFDTELPGSFRYRLMKQDTETGDVNTFVAADKHEFELTMDKRWLKWEEAHGHQVIKNGEVEYLRTPPHNSENFTPSPPRGEVVRDSRNNNKNE